MPAQCRLGPSGQLPSRAAQLRCPADSDSVELGCVTATITSRRNQTPLQQRASGVEIISGNKCVHSVWYTCAGCAQFARVCGLGGQTSPRPHQDQNSVQIIGLRGMRDTSTTNQIRGVVTPFVLW
jgi:hypothetical protein